LLDSLLQEIMKEIIVVALLCLTVSASSQKQGDGGRVNQNQKTADSKTSADANKYLFNITNGGDILALFASKKALQLELASVQKNGITSFKPKVLFDLTEKGEVSGTRNGDVVSITMKYTGGTIGAGDFSVKSAVIKMDLRVGGKDAIRSDYWQMTAASLEVAYSFNSTDHPEETIDLLPRQGYSSAPADLACTLGYSVCSPLPLTWTCNDQVLKKVNLTDVTLGSNTIILHIPGMALKPFAAGKYNGFGFNWDCEAILPISLWTTILITLGIAAIIWWALAMLSTILTPSKFDDPKGPSIHIPQSE